MENLKKAFTRFYSTFSVFVLRVLSAKTIFALGVDVALVCVLWAGWVIFQSRQPHEYCGVIASPTLTKTEMTAQGQVKSYYALVDFENETSTKMELDKNYPEGSKLCFTQSSPPATYPKLRLAYRVLFGATILGAIAGLLRFSKS